VIAAAVFAAVTGAVRFSRCVLCRTQQKHFLTLAAVAVQTSQDKQFVLAGGMHTLTAHCCHCFVCMNTCVVQAIAENMGIETDWNCAISLRPLDEPNTPDPHRMTSSYADWDVKVTRQAILNNSLFGSISAR
jgi:hypothetical protein